MTGFNNLLDKSKINVQPDRVRIRKVTKSGTLKSILIGFGADQNDLEKLALLNGVTLDTQISANKTVKSVEKGR
jgi:predicted Zn-dependent protease